MVYHNRRYDVEKVKNSYIKYVITLKEGFRFSDGSDRKSASSYDELRSLVADIEEKNKVLDRLEWELEWKNEDIYIMEEHGEDIFSI